MAVFASTKRTLGFVIDPGGRVLTKVSETESIWVTISDITIRFDNHTFNSEIYFKNHEQQLLNRGWTEEKICERLRKADGFKRDFWEMKPPTMEERKKTADALRQRAEDIMKEVDKIAPPELKTEPVVKTPLKKEFPCDECDKVFDTWPKLRGHKLGKHAKAGTKVKL